MRRTILGMAGAALVVLALSAGASARPEIVTCPLDPETGECLPPPRDSDGDGRTDGADNCPTVYNPGQEDNDGDGAGNACDPTPDGDGDGGGGGGGGDGGGGGTGGGGGSDRPEYDPAYAEGGGEDQSWYEQLCGFGYDMASCYEAVGNAKAIGCADVGAYVLKRNSVTRIWLFSHRLRFCWNGSSVTSVWNRVVDGQILIPGWARSFYPWEWMIVSDSAPAGGASPTVSFVKARFKMCGAFRVGPVCVTDEPWISLELRGDGSAVCRTSAGRVRDCRWPS